MISDRSLKFFLRSDRRVLLLGDLVRAAIAGAVILGIVLWLVYYAAVARVMVSRMEMNDFGRFYYSARLFLNGQDMYGPTPATPVVVAPGVVHEFLNMNPPHFHLPLLPLAMLPPRFALLLWTLASVAVLGWSLRLIARELQIKLTPTGLLWGVAAIVMFSATGTVIATGQLSLLLLLPITLAWLSARQGAWIRTGLWLGFAMSLKPFLCFFLPYFILRRRWEAAFAAIAAVAGAFGAGAVIFGTAAYAAWVRALGLTDWTWAAMNGSVLGVLTRTLSGSPYFTPMASAPDLVRPLWLALAAAVAVTTLAALWRDDTRDAVDRGFFLVLLGAQLISPLGWIYYFWLPAGPAAALFLSWLREDRDVSRDGTASIRWRNGLALASLPLFAWPLALVTIRQPSGVATLTIGSVYFWATLLIWAAVLFDHWRAIRSDSPAISTLRAH